jgi:hypothetical protein
MRDDYEEADDAEDGDAETEATVSCPHCGESVEITLDPSGGDVQEYIEDCEVCCNPWTVRVQFGADGHADVEVTPLDE